LFCFRDTRGRASVGFTDRHGGVSPAPYDSLNLAAGDDPEVERNLGLVAEAFGVRQSRIVFMDQVHGSAVRVVGEPAEAGSRPRVDGLVTGRPGLALAVRVADCVPVLLADPEAGVVGCAHAGRKGLIAGVVTAAVAAMRGLGAADLVAWVGPHICGSCYEVPEQMRDQVAAAVPESWAVTSWGTPSLDLGAGVRAQLSAAGCCVVDAARCTREAHDLYSYRRDGVAAGRFAGLVQLLPEGAR
jgi:YfiH family protein